MRKFKFFMELVACLLIHIAAVIIFIGGVLAADIEKINPIMIFIALGISMTLLFVGHGYTETIKLKYPDQIPVKVKKDEEKK